jgi:V/A-type H+/Na+-transporting ATPase subunit F
LKYFVIGDEDTVLGFSLVGVDGAKASTADEALLAFQRALENHEYGIIIITEAVSDLIRGTVDKYLFSEAFPLIVEIPSPSEGKYQKDLRALVNDAIGVSL